MCRIQNLYQHIFPPDVAPSISFVGLPWKVVPFAQYELQAKWIARVLSGRARLPSRQEMQAHIQALYKELELNNIPKRCAAVCTLARMHVSWLAAVAACHSQKVSPSSAVTTPSPHDGSDVWQRFQCDLVPCRYTHMLGDKQWSYNDWLADACGDVGRLPEWRPLMYKVAGQ